MKQVAVKLEEPTNWSQVYHRLKSFREINKAPVDTVGCAALGKGDEKTKRFQTLVALMLSPQTRDELTAKAIMNLRHFGIEHDSHEFDLSLILNMQIAELEKCINCVGFYRVKAKNLKKMAELVNNSDTKDIPDSLEGLVALPGVGPKIAYLCLQCAWGKVDGIGVDVHVHRISNRLGWTQACKTPEKTRNQLELFLPKEHWVDINTILVGFGQTVCNAKSPNCGHCPVNDLCPSANLQKLGNLVKSKKIKKAKKKLDDLF